MVPHGACAVCVEKPLPGELFVNLPLGLPLPMSILVHGCFGLPSSRKHVPLGQGPGGEDAPLDHRWNWDLLQHAVATSLVKLLVACTQYVTEGRLALSDYLLCMPGHAAGVSDMLSNALSRRTMQLALDLARSSRSAHLSGGLKCPCDDSCDSVAVQLEGSVPGQADGSSACSPGCAGGRRSATRVAPRDLHRFVRGRLESRLEAAGTTQRIGFVRLLAE